MLPKSRLPDTAAFRVISYSRLARGTDVEIIVAQQNLAGDVIGMGTLSVPVAELDPHVVLGGMEAGVRACVASRFPTTGVSGI